VWCVGDNYWGQLGNGTTQGSDTFVRVRGIADATALRLRDDTACAVRTGGSVWCWGHDQDRSFPGPLDPRWLTPTQIAGISRADDVGVGYDHACAHEIDGSVRCWGGNALGQLGDGSGQDSSSPVLAAAPGSADAIASAAYDNCIGQLRTARRWRRRRCLRPHTGARVPLAESTDAVDLVSPWKAAHRQAGARLCQARYTISPSTTVIATGRSGSESASQSTGSSANTVRSAR
jgi:hypothetical protein